jgi:two-component system chemotaxis response regulator CheY
MQSLIMRGENAMDTLNILTVDDSPIITRKLGMMLEQLGYKVVRTAATGIEAIAAYRACRPDVVTMDITMPDMDGIEATRTIVSEFPQAKIVMVTAHGQEKMVLDALKAGAKGYVLKPFQQHKVYEAIQKACKRVVHQDRLLGEIEQREMQTKAAGREASANPAGNRAATARIAAGSGAGGNDPAESAATRAGESAGGS